MWSQDITWEISTNPAGLSWYQDTRATSPRSKLSGAKAHSQFLRPTVREQQEKRCPWRRMSWKQGWLQHTQCPQGPGSDPAASKQDRQGARHSIHLSKQRKKAWIYPGSQEQQKTGPERGQERLQCKSKTTTQVWGQDLRHTRTHIIVQARNEGPILTSNGAPGPISTKWGWSQ